MSSPDPDSEDVLEGVKRGWFIVAVWFVGDGTQDWTACLARKPDGEWSLRYRFRYYTEVKAFDSGDVKSRYGATAAPETPEEELLASLRTIAKLVGLRFRCAPDEMLVRSDKPEDFIRCAEGRKWMHIKGAGADA